MNQSRFDTLVRALTTGASTRRALSRGLAGLAVAAGLAHAGWDDLEAKKRKKGKGKGKKRRPRGGNGGGGGDDRCQFEICEGQCVDLETDANNCGACGDACPSDTVCVGGLCAFALGTRGDALLQFDGPAGVTFSNSGRGGVAFVADANNQRVAAVSGLLAFDTFGRLGEGDGQFLRPAGVAITAPFVFVTDTERHRIQRFDLDGRFEEGAGSFGSGIGEFSSPHGIAGINRTGRVFVADTGNHSIQRLGLDLTPVERIGRQGSGDGEFNFPKGIAVDGDENLVVADTGNNRVQVIDQNGNLVRAFGRAGNGDGEFAAPVGVAVNRSGEDTVLVVDQGNNRIQQFSNDGQFLRAFGRQGTGVGELESPFGIAIDNRGVIAVADQGNHRLQFFFPASLFAGGADVATVFGAPRGNRSALKQRRRMS